MKSTIMSGSSSGREITPLTLGVISEPPCLVLFYEEAAVVKLNGDGERKKNKRRKRKIPLRQFTDKSSVQRYAQNVRIRHGEYLENVPQVVIEKMLRIIQEIIQGHDPDEAAVKIHGEYAINPEQDLNKLPQEEVNRTKMIMDEVFEKNRLRPSDPGYQYDKQVDFSTDQKVKSGWDDDEEDEEEDGRGGKKEEEKEIYSDQKKAEETCEVTKDIPDLVLDETDKIETFEGNDDEDYFW